MHPIFCKLERELGSLFMTSIPKGEIAAAYVENNCIIIIPIGGRYYEPLNKYYTAPYTGAINTFLEKEIQAEILGRGQHEIGTMIEGVWKAGFVGVAPDDDFASFRRDRQELFGIMTKLLELFQTLEPDKIGLRAHGSKIRELHLLACMEVESYFKLYFPKGSTSFRNHLNTADYYKLKRPLELHNFSVSFLQFPATLSDIKPFGTWKKSKPTRSLRWYDNYNASKHDRRTGGVNSNVKSAVEAVAAVIILFAIRHGIKQLFIGGDILSTLTEGGVDVQYHGNVKNSYVPRINSLEKIHRPCVKYIQSFGPWQVKPLVL